MPKQKPKPLPEPSARLLDYLQSLDELIEAWGYAPTIAELADAQGVVVTAAKQALERLRDMELVAWRPCRGRTLRVTDLGRRILNANTRDT